MIGPGASNRLRAMFYEPTMAGHTSHPYSSLVIWRKYSVEYRAVSLTKLLAQSDKSLTIIQGTLCNEESRNCIGVGVLSPPAKEVLLTVSSCHNLYDKSESSINNLIVTGGYWYSIYRIYRKTHFALNSRKGNHFNTVAVTVRRRNAKRFALAYCNQKTVPIVSCFKWVLILFHPKNSYLTCLPARLFCWLI